MRITTALLSFTCLFFCSQPASAEETNSTDSSNKKQAYEALVAEGVARGLIDSLYLVPYSIEANKPLPPRDSLHSEYSHGMDMLYEEFYTFIDSLLPSVTERYGSASEEIIPFLNRKAESLISIRILGWDYQNECTKEARLLLTEAISILDNNQATYDHPARLRIELNLAYCKYYDGEIEESRLDVKKLIPLFEQAPIADIISLGYSFNLLSRCMLGKEIYLSMVEFKKKDNYEHIRGAEYASYLAEYKKVEKDSVIPLLDRSRHIFTNCFGAATLEVRQVLEVLAPIYFSQEKYTDYLLALEAILYINFMLCWRECEYICYEAGDMLYGNIQPEFIESRLAAHAGKVAKDSTEYHEQFRFNWFYDSLIKTYRTLLLNIKEQKDILIEVRLHGTPG